MSIREKRLKKKLETALLSLRAAELHLRAAGYQNLAGETGLIVGKVVTLRKTMKAYPISETSLPVLDTGLSE